MLLENEKQSFINLILTTYFNNFNNIKMNKDELLKAIEEKYEKLGVPLETMLEGLLHSTPITYWDYIQTDALLGLQIPRTTEKDEMVFIMYHQVNELLFKMILWEIDQISLSKKQLLQKNSQNI